jgi:signal transduction histidine kinase/ActR/RegA family two-component response regulator
VAENTLAPEPSAKLSHLFDAFSRVITQATILLGPDDTILAANNAAGRLFGRSSDALVGTTLFRHTSNARDDVNSLLRLWRRTTSPLPGAMDLLLHDGELLRCRAEGARIACGHEKDGYVVLSLVPAGAEPSQFLMLNRQLSVLKTEVIRRRRVEERLVAQNDLLARIAEGRSLASVLDGICQFIEHRSDHALCSILLVDDQQSFRLGAAPSLPPTFNQAIDGLSIGPQVGSCGAAAYHRRVVIATDIATDPLWSDFRELALSHGLRACWSTPLIGANATVLGTVAMYYRRPGEPDGDDLNLTAVARALAIIAIERHHTEEKLLHRAEQLLEADRRKDRFLAMLSHELRNPLAPILSSVQLLAERTNDDDSRALVERLKRQTGHLCRLVDDLLDVSRINHDKIELRMETVDYRQVVDDALDSVRELIRDKQQQLTFNQHSEPLWVSGDPVRLGQIISNLLINAMKYTQPGGKITLSLNRSNGEAIVRVRDNGRGMSAEELVTIFDPFVQVTPTAELRNGLGLGLTLARKLAQRHKGSVEAHSGGPGHGCEFIVAIPLCDPPPTSALEPPLHRPEASQGSSLTILVAEDNRDGAEAFAELLQLWGHTVETVYDGVAAIERANTLRPDVFFVDVDLPGKSGFEVARVLSSKNERPSNSLLIAVTGFGRREDIERSLEAGFHQHLVKPVNISQVHRLLTEFSEQPRSLVADEENATL